MRQYPLGVLAGGLTIAGLALIAAAMVGHSNPAVTQSLLWFYLLCAGAGCTLIGGITWAHTRGNRGLKTIFLGATGCAGGALLGAFLGDQLPGNLGTEIWAVLIGSLVGAILLASCGVWWGIRISRRLRSNAVGFPLDAPRNKV